MLNNKNWKNLDDELKKKKNKFINNNRAMHSHKKGIKKTQIAF